MKLENDRERKTYFLVFYFMCGCITTFARVYAPVNQTRRTRPCRDVENHLDFQRCSVGGGVAPQMSISHGISNWNYVNWR